MGLRRLRRFRRLRFHQSPEGDTIIAMVALAPREKRLRRLRRFRRLRFFKNPEGDTIIAMAA